MLEKAVLRDVISNFYTRDQSLSMYWSIQMLSSSRHDISETSSQSALFLVIRWRIRPITHTVVQESGAK